MFNIMHGPIQNSNVKLKNSTVQIGGRKREGYSTVGENYIFYVIRTTVVITEN